MSDFSDKYKDALEKMEISPDFKERTEKMMIGLRDSEKPHVRNISLYRRLSVFAATAACIAVGFSLNRAGVFDKTSSPAVIETDIIEENTVTSAETSLPETTAAEITENAPEAKAKQYDIREETAVSVETARETAADKPIEEEPALDIQNDVQYKEEPATDDAFADASLPVPGQGYYTESSQAAESSAEMPVEVIANEPQQQPVVTDYTPAAEEAAEEELFLAEAEYIPPSSSEATVEDEEMDDAAADAAEGLSGLSDNSYDGGTVVAYYSSAEDFYAKDIIKSFKASRSYAVITPLAADCSADGETAAVQPPKTLRSVKDITELEKNMYAYIEGQTASARQSAPPDSRYIIDLADDQGNALRVYIGSRYICFSLSDGSIYSYELSSENFDLIDSTVTSLIS